MKLDSTVMIGPNGFVGVGASRITTLGSFSSTMSWKSRELTRFVHLMLKYSTPIDTELFGSHTVPRLKLRDCSALRLGLPANTPDVLAAVQLTAVGLDSHSAVSIR